MRVGLRDVLICLILLALVGCGSETGDPMVDANGPPVQAAGNDNYLALGNTPLTVEAPQGLLANDPPGQTVTGFSNPSNRGGTVAVRADGSFTYTPPAGFVGQDSFTYNLPDGQRPMVSLTVGPLVFYVDNTAAAGGNGSFNSRFDNLAAGLAAAGPGDRIFVFRGDGTPTGLAGPVALQNGQQLLGEGAGLANLNRQILAQLVPSNQPPSLTGPITLADSNTVRGLRILGSPTHGIVANGVNGATISDNSISNCNLNGVELIDSSGTLAITNNTIGSDGNHGIQLTQAQGVLRLQISGNSITDEPVNGINLLVSGTAEVDIESGGNSVVRSGDRGYFSRAIGQGIIRATHSSDVFDTTGHRGLEYANFDRGSTTAQLVGCTSRSAATTGLSGFAFDQSNLDFTLTRCISQASGDSGLTAICGDDAAVRTRFEQCLASNTQGRAGILVVGGSSQVHHFSGTGSEADGGANLAFLFETLGGGSLCVEGSNNLGDSYTFDQLTGGGVLRVVDFANFGANNGNFPTPTLGVVTDVNSCP